MIVAVTPVDRRDVVAALAPRQVVAVGGRLGHQLVEPLLARSTGARRRPRSPSGTSSSRSGPAPRLAGQLVAEPGVVAEVGVAGRVDERRAASTVRRPPRVATTSASTRPSRTRASTTVACSRIRAPASLDEPLPDDLEVLGEVGDAGPGAVGVRPLDDRAERAQPGDDLVGDPADDLARARARREEAVERVEDRGRCPAEERQRVDEQRPRAAAGRRDGRGRAGRAAADDHDVEGAVGRRQLARPTAMSTTPRRVAGARSSARWTRARTAGRRPSTTRR